MSVTKDNFQTSLKAKAYSKGIGSVLEFVRNPISKIKADEVLVKIYAAGLNPVDYKIIYGQAKRYKNHELPFSVGFDCAGIILELGPDVKNFKNGDKIFSKVPWHQMGTVSTHAIVDSKAIAKMPEQLSFCEAASLPLVGCTVIESFNLANLKKGDSILILGGSGGIGTFAIQYAKQLGAIVYTTTSTVNINLVKSLGADFVIDYTKEDFKLQLKNIDVVYDTVGGKPLEDSIQVLKKGGKLISIAGHYDNATLKTIGIPCYLRFLNDCKNAKINSKIRQAKIFYKHLWSFPNQKTLNQISDLINQQKIKPVIDKEYLFEEAISALQYLETNRVKGKIVIRIV